MWKVIVTEGETKYGPDSTWIDLRARHGLDKLASAGVYVPPTLVSKIEELQATIPRDKVAFYNRALGTFESFGLNRNGDGFDRVWLDRKHDTFVKNAHYFLHHQNRDPALSRGRPAASAFNERTDMVDLIIVADMDKCADQIQALESGRRVPTSMGAKVAHDVCTICDHRAKTRDEYCGHVHKLADAPYGMGQILGDGRVCGVKNPDPNFFDLSDVLIGAAPESETLLKVASATGAVSGAELADLLGLGKFARDVEATMAKRVPGVIEGSPIFRRRIGELSPGEVDIPDAVIDAARADSGFDGVLRNSAALGIVLKPGEFAKAAGLGSFDPPTLDEIWASEPVPKKVMAAALSSRSLDLFSDYYDRRSAHMPALLNRLPEMKTASVKKTASGNDDRARKMYVAYRRGLLDDGPEIGGGQGRYWSMKCAGTQDRMFTARTRDYMSSAFLGQQHAIYDKVLDVMGKIAEPFPVVSRVTETMADELGAGALDQLAVDCLRVPGL